jgi:hypothetical protein
MMRSPMSLLLGAIALVVVLPHAGTAQPSVGLLAASPNHLEVNQVTTVTFSVSITNPSYIARCRWISVRGETCWRTKWATSPSPRKRPATRWSTPRPPETS